MVHTKACGIITGVTRQEVKEWIKGENTNVMEQCGINHCIVSYPAMQLDASNSTLMSRGSNV